MAKRSMLILGLAFLSFLLVAGGTIACKGGEEETEGTTSVKKGELEFEGTVKFAVGKYVFIPEVRGFDVVIQGSLNSGELADLAGKEVRGIGAHTPERPSILIANTLEVKDESGTYAPVFTRNLEEEVVLDDFLGVSDRDTFVVLENINYSKKEDWEGKEKARTYGKLEESEDGTSRIVVYDDKGKEAGKIVIDSFTDYAQYYIQKLRLFGDFWFYLNVKDTVEWQTRRRTRELFNADVLFAGLF